MLFSKTTLLLLSTLAATSGAHKVDVTLSFSGLEDLGENFRYEGWLKGAAGVVSTGIFQAETDGSYEGTFKGIDGEKDGKEPDDFVLTIEPYPDSDPTPSSTHVLAGALGEDGVAVPIGVKHGAALGSDFMDAAGTYILAAPTGPADFSLGIWWLGEGQAPGLTLPTLPAGWVYEGWVASDAGAVSTGRFTDASMPDSDGAGSTAGTEDAPGVPGQDFINPPTNLTMGFTAVISIEPEPDNSAAPFAFKPLVHPITATEGGVSQTMNQNLGSLGSGTVKLTESEEKEPDSGVRAVSFLAATATMAVGFMFA